MIKPILVNDSFKLENIIFLIKYILVKHLKVFLIITFLYLLYFFLIKEDTFSSKLSFYTNYNEEQTLSSFGFLSSVAGLSSSNQIGFSISNYIKSDRFLNEIVNSQYSINGQSITLADYWEPKSRKIFSLNPLLTIEKINKRLSLSNEISKEEIKKIYAKEKISDSIRYSEDRLSSLHKINFIMDENPSLLMQISQKSINSIVNYSTGVSNNKAAEKKEFILGRISEISIELEESEESLKVFLENNKNSNSPAFIMQKQRLERDIVLYSQLFLSLSDQLEVAKIDEKDTTSSIYLLDSPNISPYKFGSTLVESIISINIFLLVLFICIISFQKRKKLFVYEE